MAVSPPEAGGLDPPLKRKSGFCEKRGSCGGRGFGDGVQKAMKWFETICRARQIILSLVLGD